MKRKGRAKGRGRKKEKLEERGKKKEEGKIKLLGIGMGKTFIAVFAGIIILYLVGFAYFYFAGEKPSFSIVEKEGKLEKVVPLQINPGESYLYEYRFNNTPVFQAGYEIGEGDGCTTITPSSYSNTTAGPVCVDRWGNEKGGGNNLTYENSTIYLFSPWMLALKEGWKWEVNVTMAAGGLGIESTSRFLFKAVSEEKKFGRDTYKIEVTVSGDEGTASEPMLWWIDKEKRILLMQKMGDDEMRLVKAPFTLEQQEG